MQEGRTTAETRGRGRCTAERTATGLWAWRLKAPNGRVVGVSPPVFRSREAALAAVWELGEGGERLARITHEREGVGWVWSVPGPQGRPVANSPRSYERYATCRKAFATFLTLLGVEPGGAGTGVDGGGDDAAAAAR